MYLIVNHSQTIVDKRIKKSSLKHCGIYGGHPVDHRSELKVTQGKLLELGQVTITGKKMVFCVNNETLVKNYLTRVDDYY